MDNESGDEARTISRRAWLRGGGAALAGAAGASLLLAEAAGASGTDVYNVSVMDHGAVGDGVTNDTAAINLAVAAAGNDGTVFFPKGVYAISALITVPFNVSVLGEGNGTNGPWGSGSRILCTTASAGFTFSGGQFGSSVAHITFDGNGVSNLPLEVTDGSGRGFYNVSAVGSNQDCARIRSQQNAAYVNCNFGNAAGRDALVLDGGAGGLLFSRCQISNAARFNLRLCNDNPNPLTYLNGVADLVFDQCIVEHWAGGVQSGIRIQAASDVTFRHCGIAYDGLSLPTGPLIDITGPTLAHNIDFDNCLTIARPPFLNAPQERSFAIEVQPDPVSTLVHIRNHRFQRGYTGIVTTGTAQPTLGVYLGGDLTVDASVTALRSTPAGQELTIRDTIRPDPWRNATLVNGYGPYNPLLGMIAAPGFRRLPDGRVELRGAVQGGGLATNSPTTFVLPVGYRPVNDQYFEARSDPNTGFFIKPNGELHVQKTTLAAVTFVHFAGVTFPTD